jgi:hypothetical protein
MFKKILVGTLLVGLIGILAAGAVIRTASITGVAKARGQGHGRSEQPDSYETNLNGRGRGGGWGQGGASEHLFDPAVSSYAPGAGVTGALSTAESEGLLYMREEEKLAHDVYVTLYEKWGLPNFQNIAQSEQTHTEAVKTLIERYGLPDPAASQAVGVFTNPELQKLYNELVAQGSQSVADALRVGAAIEEIDILDLQERLAQTDRADIQTVYQNLVRGSGNHLQAFTANLVRQTGQTYQPRYLNQADYQSIVGGAGGSGGRGRRGQ